MTLSSKDFGSFIWLLALSLLLACSPPAALAKRPQTSLSEQAAKSRAATLATEETSASEFTLNEPETYPKAKPRHTVSGASNEIAALTRTIILGASSDRERARAIYDWIARNIRYDIKSFLAGKYPDPEAIRVLATRMAVCEGYSRLFVAMASAAGLEAVTISGYSKGFSRRDEAPDRKKPNHAWNAVKLDGQWHLLDATWGAGHIDKEELFIAEYNPRWFDVTPRHFAVSHLPVDPKWQLLEQALTAEAFWALPDLDLRAFDYGLRLDSHHESLIKASGLFQVRISSAKPCSMSAKLFEDGQEVEGSHTLVERKGTTFTISVLPPEARKYILVIFVGGLEEEVRRTAVSYEVASSSRSDQSFPKAFETFGLRDVQLQSPRFIPLQRQKTTFAIKAPGAHRVMAKDGESRVLFKKIDRDIFEAVIGYSGSKLIIFASYDDSNKYEGLIEF